MPLIPTVVAASLLGPAIGVGSIGLRQLIVLHQPSVMATLAAVFNFAAGAVFTTMALVQLAARSAETPLAGLVSVWLGIDVAWDVYIGLGTLLFAASMIGHPRYGWMFAGPGLLIAIVMLVLNLTYFPAPPAESGSFDAGPLVGLWYLAATIQAWRSLSWTAVYSSLSFGSRKFANFSSCSLRLAFLSRSFL